MGNLLEFFVSRVVHGVCGAQDDGLETLGPPRPTPGEEQLAVHLFCVLVFRDGVVVVAVDRGALGKDGQDEPVFVEGEGAAERVRQPFPVGVPRCLARRVILLARRRMSGRCEGVEVLPGTLERLGHGELIVV